MRNWKIIGFVAACIALVALLVLVSTGFGPDDVDAPPSVAIPSEERPVATRNEPPPMNVPKRELPDLTGGRVAYDAEDIGRIVRPGDEKPLETEYESWYGGGHDLSYNPELRRLGLHVDDEGDLRHGTKEQPGGKAAWETLRELQRGEYDPRNSRTRFVELDTPVTLKEEAGD